MAPPPASQDGSKLSAHYISPSESKDFTLNLPNATASARSTEEKTAYLSELRKSVVQLQDEVNAFLTQKMEEDKSTVGGVGAGKDDVVDEKKAEELEENYGEENMGEG